MRAGAKSQRASTLGVLKSTFVLNDIFFPCLCSLNVFSSIYFKIPFPFLNLIECVNYMTLSEPTRAISDQSGSVAEHCDNEVSGWYRFDGDAGDRMTDVCPAQPRLYRCGTYRPGWLRGGHPTVADGIVERTVCFSLTTNCCWRSYKVNVRNCGHFYVYKLVPLYICNARYCGNG